MSTQQSWSIASTPISLHITELYLPMRARPLTVTVDDLGYPFLWFLAPMNAEAVRWPVQILSAFTTYLDYPWDFICAFQLPTWRPTPHFLFVKGPELP